MEKNTLKPCMTEEEIEYFKSILIDCKEYFEFGIGGSTVFAYDCFVEQIKGVDSSKEWIQKVIDETNDSEKINIKYVDIGDVERFGYPKDENLKINWPEYSKSIWNLAKEPDVILIDGRFRVACAIQTVLFCIKNNLRPKILLHDCDRDEYRFIYKIMNPLKKIQYITNNEKGLQLFEIMKNNNIAYLENFYETYKYIKT